MVSTIEAVEAISRSIGFARPRVRAVAKYLTDRGKLPAGAPGKSPELDVDDVVNLIIATAADVPLRAVADAVGEYRALTPGGADVTGAPSSIPDTAGDALDILAEIAVRGDSEILRRDIIEIVSSWPEIAIHDPGAVRRFQPVGSLSDHWQNRGHRRSTSIDGAAFVDTHRELFMGDTHAKN